MTASSPLTPPSIPLALRAHASMVSDQVRTRAYAYAIKEAVTYNDVVVDLGSGTGQLAMMAARRSPKHIIAIECDARAASISNQVIDNSCKSKVEVIVASSTDVQLFNPHPTLLITETIGPTGPEEGIVELCYNFVMRHPSISRVIPAQLNILLQPCYSEFINNEWDAIRAAFQVGSFLGCQYKNAWDDIQWQAAHEIYRRGHMADAVNIGSPLLLANYTLGSTSSSNFHRQISLCDEPHWNGFLLYFEALLVPGVIISTSNASHPTHWGHSYVLRPGNSSSFDVSFKLGWRTPKVIWHH